MLTPEDNVVLTATGPDTPMGQYFRRFWQPVALSSELPEPDGAPIMIDVMGEELVAFRDSEGKVGIIDRWCPHRRANLYYGRNEGCGLRCVYHGWKFNRSGQAVDMPNVPSDSKLRDEVTIRAYPAEEFGDVVWAYMGPAEVQPSEPPRLEFGVVPPEHRFVSKRYNECNWAQTMEGGLDTSHFSFLHMPAPSVPSDENPDAPADARRLRWIRNDPMPQFSLLEHDVGFVVGGARAGDPAQTYWRITQYLLPSHGTGPSTLPGETYFGYTLVPISDTAHWMYTYAWNPERPIDEQERAKLRAGHGICAEVDENYRGIRNKGNDYLISRSDQRDHSYTGVRGLAEQDAMIQESQGPIVDRSKETLTGTDAAVVRFRRTVIDAAKRLASGQEPSAPNLPQYYNTRPGSWMASEGTAFEDVLVERFGDRLGRNN